MDQPALRISLVASGLRFINLPANYNFRANFDQVITGHVKLLHAHGKLAEVAKTINVDLGIRLYRTTPV